MQISVPSLQLFKFIAASAAIIISFFPFGSQAQGRPQATFLNVPFVMQAPFDNWADDRQQYGCKEASIVMAMAWARREITSSEDMIYNEEALRDIINMSEYERVMFGVYEDTSAADTARLVREFYQYQNVELKYNITTEDIKVELAKIE